jgi:beta-aspartyl-peptidase (threonine type)
MSNSTFCLAIHGGAGTILQREMTPDLQKSIRETLRQSIGAGIAILENNGSAVDATVTAVMIMEDSPLFNAGKGSVFNSEGFIEMDASVMCGKTLNAGAVTCVRNVRNPVLLAKMLLDHKHVLLCGDGAESYARLKGLAFESDEYFFTQHRFDQLAKAQGSKLVQPDKGESNDGNFGTVGAVALDRTGNLATATSTGGMTDQLPGRIGDTPLIGSGAYADNRTCAVSCTGTGESFVRGVAAYDVSALIQYRGLSLKEACRNVIFDKLPLVKGEGGLIAVDRHGTVALPFNSDGMYRAWCCAGGEIQVRIYHE